jgi:uncharacterized GH25 family protein
MTRFTLTAALALLGTIPAFAHDTWVQTNTAVVRAGDNVHIDLMLGNHGNDHRDFKLASKISLEGATLQVFAPNGKKYDLKDRLDDVGYTPKEGYWTLRFSGAVPGLYMVAHTSDHVVSYAPTRSVKSAKTFFLVSKSLDKVPAKNPGFDKVLGHALELVPEASTVAPMGPDTPIKVRLLYKGKPLANARVSFIPRGTSLKEGFDDRYERKTDARGSVSFKPAEGNYYLVVAHHVEPKEAGTGYKSTKYSATLTVLVPQVCPCCGE